MPSKDKPVYKKVIASKSGQRPKPRVLLANNPPGADLCYTQATVTAPLEFLYEWIPFHSVYTIAMFVKKCEGNYP